MRTRFAVSLAAVALVMAAAMPSMAQLCWVGVEPPESGPPCYPAEIGGIVIVADFGRTVQNGAVNSTDNVQHPYRCDVWPDSSYAYPSDGGDLVLGTGEVLHLGGHPCTCYKSLPLGECPTPCQLAAMPPIAGMTCDAVCPADGLTNASSPSYQSGKWQAHLSVGYEADLAHPDIEVKITGPEIIDQTLTFPDLPYNESHLERRVSYDTPYLVPDAWYYIQLLVHNEDLCDAPNRWPVGETENWKIRITGSGTVDLLEWR